MNGLARLRTMMRRSQPSPSGRAKRVYKTVMKPNVRHKRCTYSPSCDRWVDHEGPCTPARQRQRLALGRPPWKVSR